MNVCFVTPEYFPISGGTGAYVYYLSHSLQKFGHKVHVVARHSEDAEDVFDAVNPSSIGHIRTPSLPEGVLHWKMGCGVRDPSAC